MPSKLQVICEKCGTKQDPNRPICPHLMGKKGGAISTAKALRLYGREHFSQIGKRGAAARWARYAAKNSDKLS